MSGSAILWPAFALAGLTCVVWCRMFVVRIGQMKRERIHPQSVATSAQAAARLTDSKVADNLRNLFELPVLFYAAVSIAVFTGSATPALSALAWLFVALRFAHSAIHCTYNKVMHRFVAYLAGGIVRWLLWAYLAFLLLT